MSSIEITTSDEEIWTYKSQRKKSQRKENRTKHFQKSPQISIKQEPFNKINNKDTKNLKLKARKRKLPENQRYGERSDIIHVKQEQTPAKQDRTGRCPVCQMPFSLLTKIESSSWHLDSCLDTTCKNSEECPNGALCDSEVASHYKRYKHTQLARSLRKNKQAESQRNIGNVEEAKANLNFSTFGKSRDNILNTAPDCVIDLDSTSDSCTSQRSVDDVKKVYKDCKANEKVLRDLDQKSGFHLDNCSDESARKESGGCISDIVVPGVETNNTQPVNKHETVIQIHSSTDNSETGRSSTPFTETDDDGYEEISISDEEENGISHSLTNNRRTRLSIDNKEVRGMFLSDNSDDDTIRDRFVKQSPMGSKTKASKATTSKSYEMDLDLEVDTGNREKERQISSNSEFVDTVDTDRRLEETDSTVKTKSDDTTAIIEKCDNNKFVSRKWINKLLGSNDVLMKVDATDERFESQASSIADIYNIVDDTRTLSQMLTGSNMDNENSDVSNSRRGFNAGKVANNNNAPAEESKVKETFEDLTKPTSAIPSLSEGDTDSSDDLEILKTTLTQTSFLGSFSGTKCEPGYDSEEYGNFNEVHAENANKSLQENRYIDQDVAEKSRSERENYPNSTQIALNDSNTPENSKISDTVARTEGVLANGSNVSENSRMPEAEPTDDSNAEENSRMSEAGVTNDSNAEENNRMSEAMATNDSNADENSRMSEAGATNDSNAEENNRMSVSLVRTSLVNQETDSMDSGIGFFARKRQLKALSTTSAESEEDCKKKKTDQNICEHRLAEKIQENDMFSNIKDRSAEGRRKSTESNGMLEKSFGSQKRQERCETAKPKKLKRVRPAQGKKREEKVSKLKDQRSVSSFFKPVQIQTDSESSNDGSRFVGKDKCCMNCANKVTCIKAANAETVVEMGPNTSKKDKYLSEHVGMKEKDIPNVSGREDANLDVKETSNEFASEDSETLGVPLNTTPVFGMQNACTLSQNSFEKIGIVTAEKEETVVSETSQDCGDSQEWENHAGEMSEKTDSSKDTADLTEDSSVEMSENGTGSDESDVVKYVAKKAEKIKKNATVIQKNAMDILMASSKLMYGKKSRKQNVKDDMGTTKYDANNDLMEAVNNVLSETRSLSSRRGQGWSQRRQAATEAAVASATDNAVSNTCNRKCPFYKKIPETGFTVDAFRYGLIPDCKAYFLTHFHYDHYQGLDKHFTGHIYCTKVTGNLVKKKIGVDSNFIHSVALNTPTEIENVQVTFMEANHCPGAAIILFKTRSGKVYLHTGDFRASREMESYRELQNLKVNSLYLDTTYCDHQYDFPPQGEVITLAVQLAVEAVSSNPKTLIACGSYTIGKERIFSAIAEVLNCKICVTPTKKSVLDCLEDTKLSTMVRVGWTHSRLHVVPMNKLNYKGLQEHLSQNGRDYDNILAIEPTGWTHSKTKVPLHQIKPKLKRGNITIYGLPYSEHSSFLEMKRFVQYIRPDKILPTVNNGNPHSRRKMEVIFEDWREEMK